MVTPAPPGRSGGDSRSPLKSSASSTQRSNRVVGGGGSFGGGGGIGRRGRHIFKWCNVAFSVLLLFSLGIMSAYFDRQLHNLQSKMEGNEQNLARLDGILAQQANTIKRFNASVTNKDVLVKMQKLQEMLTNTEQSLIKRMDDQERTVEAELTRTTDELNEAVQSAETQIHAEVDSVKLDVKEYVQATQDQFSMENSFMIYQLAGTIVLIGSLISMWHMTSHLRKFRQPFVQRKILAILWMCPIYSVTSWLCLVFPAVDGYLKIIKDCYEAYVIYMFLSFLIAVLGRGDRDAVVDLLAKHADHLQPPVRICGWFFPRAYCSPRHMADAVLLQCQVFAMQFVFFKPLTSIVTVILDKTGCCGGYSNFDYRSPHFYVLIVENASVFTAFYGLLKFYHAVQTDLAWCRPWPKFLCIKGVVFMTFWQGLAIAILASSANPFKHHALTEEEKADEERWGKQAQNFLICIEMLVFSIAHFFVFPTYEWEEGYRPKDKSDARFGDNMAIRDFIQDLKLVLGGRGSTSTEGSGNTLASPSVDDDGRDLERGLSNIIERYDALEKTESFLRSDGKMAGRCGNNFSDRGMDSSPSKRAWEHETNENESTDDVDIEGLRRSLAVSLLSSEMQEATARLLRTAVLENRKRDSSTVTGNDVDDVESRDSVRDTNATDEPKSNDCDGCNGMNLKDDCPSSDKIDMTQGRSKGNAGFRSYQHDCFSGENEDGSLPSPKPKPKPPLQPPPQPPTQPPTPADPSLRVANKDGGDLSCAASAEWHDCNWGDDQSDIDTNGGRETVEEHVESKIGDNTGAGESCNHLSSRSSNRRSVFSNSSDHATSAQVPMHESSQEHGYDIAPGSWQANSEDENTRLLGYDSERKEEQGETSKNSNQIRNECRIGTDEEEPGETTSLLHRKTASEGISSTAREEENILRPSIFTTLSALSSNNEDGT